MKINELTVGRKFNLGNFEMLEIRVSVSPEVSEESQQWDAAVAEMAKKLDEKIKEVAQTLK